MKRMLVLVVLALAGCNGPNEIPEIRGKLVNHTDYPSSQFQVSALFKCSKRDLLGWRKSCGSVSKEVNVAADGSYVLPVMDLTGTGGSEYEYDLSVKLADSQGPFTGLRRYGNWRLTDGDISKYLPDLATITVFELKKQDIIYQAASGRDSREWARTVGRDSAAELEFDFGQKVPSIYYNAETRGWREESAESIPAQLLYIPGALAQDARVKVKGKLTNGALVKAYGPIATIDSEVAFASELPAQARTFSFDDRNHLVPNRDVNGKWEISINLHRGYRPGIPHGGFNGTMELDCRNGKLTGTMTVESGGGSEIPFKGDIAVNGTCNGEAGVMEFQLPLAKDGTLGTIRMAYERVAANRRWLLGRDLDKLEQFDAPAFSFNLKMRNAATNVEEGSAHVRGK